MTDGFWRAGAGAAVFLALAGPALAAQPDAAVLRAAEAQKAPALDLLRVLVDQDSGTGDAAGGEKVEGVLIPRLEALGAEVTRHPAEAPGLPDALTARLRGEGRARILVIAHIDTVFPPGTAAARPFKIVGDRATGPGVGDEKGGVVAALSAFTILKELGFRKYGELTLLIDNSEERGSPGAIGLIRKEAAAADVELNMEPGDPPDGLTVWRKGSTTIKVSVEGRAAHAGVAPQNGRNAAVELVHQIDALQGRFPTSGSGTTVNLTVLGGGTRENIIPDAAFAEFNVRYRTTPDFDAVLAAIEADAASVKVPDTKVSVTHTGAFPPLQETPAVDALARRAQAIYAALGRPLDLTGNGGASESAVAQSVGTPALDGLGFVGGDFHSDREFVDLSSVTPRIYLLTKLLMSLSLDPPVKGR